MFDGTPVPLLAGTAICAAAALWLCRGLLEEPVAA
jgi:hypothetical protein